MVKCFGVSLILPHEPSDPSETPFFAEDGLSSMRPATPWDNGLRAPGTGKASR